MDIGLISWGQSTKRLSYDVSDILILMSTVSHEEINHTLKVHHKAFWILNDDLSECAQEEVLFGVFRVNQIEDLIEECIWVSYGNITKCDGGSQSDISLLMVKHLLNCWNELALR